jgi:hypothetical protein
MSVWEAAAWAKYCEVASPASELLEDEMYRLEKMRSAKAITPDEWTRMYAEAVMVYQDLTRDAYREYKSVARMLHRPD